MAIFAQICSTTAMIDLITLPSPLALPAITTWLMLIPAIIAVLGNVRLWPALLAIALLLASYQGYLSPLGLAITAALLFTAVCGRAQIQPPWRCGLQPPFKDLAQARHLGQALTLLLCIALAAHLLPGFNNLLLLSNVQADPLSAPFSLYLNIDKPLIIFALMIMLPAMRRIEPSLPRYTIIVALLALPTLLALAVCTGLIRWEPSLPPWLLLFAVNNLLISCAAEEVLFRGVVQNTINTRWGRWPALLITSLLFGLAHSAGGPWFMLIAAGAGLSYGAIYFATGRLWCAIGLHFLFNVTHLLLFTYPLYRDLGA